MFHILKYPETHWRPECVICQRSVELEESKADEYGQAVHEECYISRLICDLSKTTAPVEALLVQWA
jgi:hypothetical protein